MGGGYGQHVSSIKNRKRIKNQGSTFITSNLSHCFRLIASWDWLAGWRGFTRGTILRIISLRYIDHRWHRIAKLLSSSSLPQFPGYCLESSFPFLFLVLLTDLLTFFSNLDCKCILRSKLYVKWLWTVTSVPTTLYSHVLNRSFSTFAVFDYLITSCFDFYTKMCLLCFDQPKRKL